MLTRWLTAFLVKKIVSLVGYSQTSYHNEASQTEKAPKSLIKKMEYLPAMEFIKNKNKKSVWYLIAQGDIIESV